MKAVASRQPGPWGQREAAVSGSQAVGLRAKGHSAPSAAAPWAHQPIASGPGLQPPWCMSPRSGPLVAPCLALLGFD